MPLDRVWFLPSLSHKKQGIQLCPYDKQGIACMIGLTNLVPRSPTAKGKGDLTFQCKTEWDLGTRLWFDLLDKICNRPFPHSCRQRHQFEARVDKIQWFVWNCPPEPRLHFFMFAHWSVMRERSIVCTTRQYTKEMTITWIYSIAMANKRL